MLDHKRIKKERGKAMVCSAKKMFFCISILLLFSLPISAAAQKKATLDVDSRVSTEKPEYIGFLGWRSLLTGKITIFPTSYSLSAGTEVTVWKEWNTGWRDIKWVKIEYKTPDHEGSGWIEDSKLKYYDRESSNKSNTSNVWSLYNFDVLFGSNAYASTLGSTKSEITKGGRGVNRYLVRMIVLALIGAVIVIFFSVKYKLKYLTHWSEKLSEWLKKHVKVSEKPIIIDIGEIVNNVIVNIINNGILRIISYAVEGVIFFVIFDFFIR